jgi:hypothetical protein
VPKRRVTVFVALAVAIGVVATLLLWSDDRARRATISPQSPDKAESLVEEAPSTPEPEEPQTEPAGAPVLDRAHADKVREQVRSLLAGVAQTKSAAPVVAAASAKAGGVPEMPAAVGAGNQAHEEQGDYIRSVVRDQFFPLAKNCYETASAAHPGLEGTAVLEFRIVGDKSVGGVVDQAALGDASDLREHDFAECMTESMMSVTFNAPPGDREVTVTYPIVFSPDDDAN